MESNYDAIVVGGGIAGLVAASYLSSAGMSTLLCEKQSACGGLINTFEYDGFVYDGGIRALENSGVLFPMLKQLGLEIDLVKNNISMGIEDRVINVDSAESVSEYQDLLITLYPESRAEIEKIILKIREIMHYMDVQYGINNPIFLDMKQDREYMLKVLVPWLFKYAFSVPKIKAMNGPVGEFLQSYTRNQSLLDIITQHFFHDTPAFFALSYIKLYLDYYYPKGGTGKLIQKMVDFIQQHQGVISTDTLISSIDPVRKVLTDQNGQAYHYQCLIWAADQKTLYRLTDIESIQDEHVQSAVQGRSDFLSDKTGNDSIFTSFIAVDLDKSYFSEKNSAHFFYTPSRVGQSQGGVIPLKENREVIEAWLERYFALTTYEISCPVLRDADLAPQGKTGLIVSVLFDYQLTKEIQEAGWYEDFKKICEKYIINTLDGSIYPGLKAALVHQFSSTPLTMEKLSGNTHGAITGWAFSNQPVPTESRLTRIMESVKTPIPDVYQAGQWTYSPSGLPISIMTGKIAADKVIKELRMKKKRRV